MRHCTVCQHPRREEIDASILDAQPYRKIAAHFAISHMSVLRHKHNHLRDDSLTDSPRILRDEIRDLNEEMRQLFEHAKHNDPSIALRAASRMERQIHLRIKLLALRDHAEPSFEAAWQTFQPKLLHLLRQDPQTLTAVTNLIASELGLPVDEPPPTPLDPQPEPAPPTPRRK